MFDNNFFAYFIHPKSAFKVDFISLEIVAEKIHDRILTFDLFNQLKNIFVK